MAKNLSNLMEDMNIDLKEPDELQLSGLRKQKTGLGAAAARRSLPDSASPAGSPEVPGSCSSSAGLDLKDSGLKSPAAAEAPLRGQYKVTASPETAVAGVGHELGTAGDAGARPDLAGTCQAELTAAGSEEPSSAGGLSSSCSDPSPPGESPSLDSLESFSNLHSFPSSCEFNSEEGAENRVPEEDEGAAVLPGAVPLCKEEEGEETAQIEEAGSHSHSFFEASITLMLKPNKAL
ncbi:ubiquitin carboxyl-terminal hydrolase MINDY-2-like [Gorilla gorilla gorilla]|uniref:ubiquitin carboxyl-terminal hydrolase MINDY-2-like n=1 Tax=Gorilla gorilla gorilla TaxID=9595 RepID=UPI00300A88F5